MRIRAEHIWMSVGYMLVRTSILFEDKSIEDLPIVACDVSIDFNPLLQKDLME
jgi:hypothetical protein